MPTLVVEIVPVRVVEIVPVLSGEIVPVVVVEIVPVFVVEIVPDLVVEMVPPFAKVVAEKAKTRVAAQATCLMFFISCSCLILKSGLGASSRGIL
jgi:hypothetical protein